LPRATTAIEKQAHRLREHLGPRDHAPAASLLTTSGSPAAPPTDHHDVVAHVCRVVPEVHPDASVDPIGDHESLRIEPLT
jgi:hypothetical protein